MKVLLLFLFVSTFCFAEANPENLEIYSQMSLQQISEKTDIPLKKIIQYLDLDASINSTRTLDELDVSGLQLKSALEEYEKNKNSLYGSIVLVGMSIVFISLIIVGFFIYSLQHLDLKKKPKLKTVPTAIGKITAAPAHISSNAIVAVIAAIHLHEAEVEEKNRLLLTWTRSRLSMWSAANMMESRFINNRRGK